MNVKQLLAKDSYLAGIIQAFVIQLVGAFLILLISRLANKLSGTHYLDDSKIILLSTIPNLLIMRYHIVKSHLEKTGKGVLMVTALTIVLYFIFVNRHPFTLPF